MTNLQYRGVRGRYRTAKILAKPIETIVPAVCTVEATLIRITIVIATLVGARLLISLTTCRPVVLITALLRIVGSRTDDCSDSRTTSHTNQRTDITAPWTTRDTTDSRADD